MDGERFVGGLWCREVLAALSDHLGGQVGENLAHQIADHLAGCDTCERFGGEFTAIVEAFHAGLAEPPPVPEEVAARLAARLEGTLTPRPSVPRRL